MANSSDVASFLDDDSADEEAPVWAQPFQRSWEQIEEDESGLLKSMEIQQQRVDKRKIRVASSKLLEKGMIRYLYVIVDFSKAMSIKDLKPSRKILSLHLLQNFIKEFFDQNPISQLGLLAMCNNVAEKLTNLSGNPQQQIDKLMNCSFCGGEVSLQNAIDTACLSLRQIPSFGSREILILMGSLTSCDPGDILQSIQALKQYHIRCSVVGLAAELHICRVMTDQTSGTYSVVKDERHFREILSSHIPPVPNPVSSTSLYNRKWIHMAFPQKRVDPYPSLCACHNDFRYGGYFCPQCCTKFCELPTDCLVCGLTLASTPHLARSYHHLAPVPAFFEVPATKHLHCYACMNLMDPTKSIIVSCPKCTNIFCLDCDVYIHESLHNCPACLSK